MGFAKTSSTMLRGFITCFLVSLFLLAQIKVTLARADSLIEAKNEVPANGEAAMVSFVGSDIVPRSNETVEMGGWNLYCLMGLYGACSSNPYNYVCLKPELIQTHETNDLCDNYCVCGGNTGCYSWHGDQTPAWNQICLPFPNGVIVDPPKKELAERDPPSPTGLPQSTPSATTAWLQPAPLYDDPDCPGFMKCGTASGSPKASIMYAGLLTVASVAVFLVHLTYGVSSAAHHLE